MDLQLEGKVAVVTGASKGIGLAATEAIDDLTTPFGLDRGWAGRGRGCGDGRDRGLTGAARKQGGHGGGAG
jgi:hypothetical protein